ncbi:hypothetical protein C4571_00720 [Candidatus Parcubacteria bacterium]|nr:MAG: hypothetical protein C4571_00720 [Candidatus Parcubacteria bacterium]
MLIVLYGPDAYRRHRKKRSIIDEFTKRHGALNVRVFDLLEESARARFSEFGNSESIFGSARFAVLENTFDSLDKLLIEVMKKAHASSTLTVLISESASPPKTFDKLLRPPTLQQPFLLLEGQEWSQFVARETKNRNVAPTPRALAFLEEVYRGDSWRLITELDKISSLQKTSIDEEDLEALGLEVAPVFWELVSALRSSDEQKRLKALEMVFAANEPPAKVFNIISAWRGLDGAQFASYDRAVKSGKFDYEEALLDFVIQTKRSSEARGRSAI